ncbi:hypothetical protein JHW43_002546 [Diplocarpon mali]|nr:hypothetical protein JHW43_002546 [Diplocarpon mali]
MEVQRPAHAHTTECVSRRADASIRQTIISAALLFLRTNAGELLVRLSNPIFKLNLNVTQPLATPRLGIDLNLPPFPTQGARQAASPASKRTSEVLHIGKSSSASSEVERCISARSFITLDGIPIAVQTCAVGYFLASERGGTKIDWDVAHSPELCPFRLLRKKLDGRRKDTADVAQGQVLAKAVVGYDGGDVESASKSGQLGADGVCLAAPSSRPRAPDVPRPSHAMAQATAASARPFCTAVVRDNPTLDRATSRLLLSSSAARIILRYRLAVCVEPSHIKSRALFTGGG